MKKKITLTYTSTWNPALNQKMPCTISVTWKLEINDDLRLIVDAARTYARSASSVGHYMISVTEDVT